MQFASRRSSRKDAFAPAAPDRSSLPGAITRLVAVFVCAGAVQILAGWILRRGMLDTHQQHEGL